MLDKLHEQKLRSHFHKCSFEAEFYGCQDVCDTKYADMRTGDVEGALDVVAYAVYESAENEFGHDGQMDHGKASCTEFV